MDKPRQGDPRSHSGKRVRQFLLQSVLFVSYLGAAKIGLLFASINPSASAVWPPTGIAVAAFLLWGRRCWPAIFAGALVANLMTSGSVLTSLAIAIGNTLEGALGASLIARYAGGAAAFYRAPNFLRFALTALIAPLVSATIGVGALELGHYALWSEYGSIWLTWWLGDVSGLFLVAPLLVLWARSRAETWPLERYAEAGILFASLTGSAYLVFFDRFSATRNLPLEFFTLPFLLWTAFRYGPRETATSVVTLSTIATWGTLRGHGPFGGLGREGPLVLQIFMVTASITAMFTAALVVDRRRIEAGRLRSLRAEQAARSEAEAANAAKDRFMAMLGHELRNPLAAIVAGVHLLEHDSAKPEIRGVRLTSFAVR